jgi:selenide, water dikinase
VGPCDLDAILQALPHASGEMSRLLETKDDAAVIPLTDDLCLVQTVDFFTPIVDDGYWFGQIAAANALSDIYAMGAEPRTALNLIAYPMELDHEPLREILRGGADKVAEAGAELAGGHSIDDKEPKYGLAVTGLARADEIVYNRGAWPGDKLVLTKRLGIGVLASALKQELIEERDMMPAIREAAALNAAASRAMRRVGVHAATDVSGFGLLGHLAEMLDASGVGAVVDLDEVPVHDRVHDFIAQSVYAGGLRANRDYFGKRVTVSSMRAGVESGVESDVALDVRQSSEEREQGVGERPDLDDPRILALFDPQTSGGLLIAVSPERLLALFEALTAGDVEAWTIGEVSAEAGRIAIH